MEGSAATETALSEGYAALAAGEWEAARRGFESVLATEPSGAALDGLGQAMRWLGDEQAGIELRAKAFERYRREGNEAAAGNVAVYLAGEYRLAGNTSLANGWLGRAARLLEGCGDCPGSGWLEIERSKRSAASGDPEAAESHAAEALSTARRIEHTGLEASALSHIGRARIVRGDLEGGLALLDEAMAVATGPPGDDPLAVGDACCTTLIACERLADPQRARDWGRAITEFVERRNYVPLLSWCRSVYAGFLLNTGEWERAEAELERSLADSERAGATHESNAIEALAELRLLQGRLEEARELIRGVADRPQALAVAVALDLAAGEPATAAERVERRLEAVAGDVAATAATLALRAEVELAREDAGAASAAVEVLREAAGEAAREDLVARAAVLDARAAALRDEPVATQDLERAVETYGRLAMPLWEARARLALARALAPTHGALAVEQARAALRGFDALGAAPDADAAAALLRELGAPGRAAPRTRSALSKRELEVLALVRSGLSNAEIAERLVISPRTAEHHVASILRKLDLRNRAEATAYAIREGI